MASAPSGPLFISGSSLPARQGPRARDPKFSIIYVRARVGSTLSGAADLESLDFQLLNDYLFDDAGADGGFPDANSSGSLHGGSREAAAEVSESSARNSTWGSTSWSAPGQTSGGGGSSSGSRSDSTSGGGSSSSGSGGGRSRGGTKKQVKGQGLK